MTERQNDVLCKCGFCICIEQGPLSISTPTAVAFQDNFPITQGHTLVVPRQHLASIFDLTPSEYAAIFALVREVRDTLAATYGVSDFNIGVNVGAAAGQTIAHAHIHVIPRRVGDVTDPRGGVRWVIPHKADYWSSLTSK